MKTTEMLRIVGTTIFWGFIIAQAVWGLLDCFFINSWTTIFMGCSAAFETFGILLEISANKIEKKEKKESEETDNE